eukprot:gene18189-10478_t
MAAPFACDPPHARLCVPQEGKGEPGKGEWGKGEWGKGESGKGEWGKGGWGKGKGKGKPGGGVCVFYLAGECAQGA